MAELPDVATLAHLLIDWLHLDGPDRSPEWRVLRERKVAERAALIAEFGRRLDGWLVRHPERAALVAALRAAAAVGAQPLYRDREPAGLLVNGELFELDEGDALPIVHATHMDACIRDWWTEHAHAPLAERQTFAATMAEALTDSLAYLT